MDKIDSRLLIIHKTDSLGSITSKKTVIYQWINIKKKNGNYGSLKLYQSIRRHQSIFSLWSIGVSTCKNQIQQKVEIQVYHW